jgi:hypothetical protein
MTPLDFDGRADAIFHPFDEEGRSFIEVVDDHGEFDDLPYEMVVNGLRAAHAALFADPTRVRAGSLIAEAGGR